MKLIPSTHDAITGLSAKSIHVIGIVNLGRSVNASRGTLNAPATVRLDVNGVGESVCVYLGYARPALSYVVESVCVYLGYARPVLSYVVENVCVYLGYARPALSYVVENVFATILVNMDVADLMELAGHLNAPVQPECSYAAANVFALMDPMSALSPRVTVQVFVPCPRVIAQVFALYLGVTVQVFAISHMAVIKAAARDSELFGRIT